MSADRIPTFYVDADACPVKDEVYKVAARYAAPVKVVSNSFMMVPKDPLIERVVVDAGPDIADDWIAERAGRGDIVITADIPLAGALPEGQRAGDRPARRCLHRDLRCFHDRVPRVSWPPSLLGGGCARASRHPAGHASGCRALHQISPHRLTTRSSEQRLAFGSFVYSTPCFASLCR